MEDVWRYAIARKTIAFVLFFLLTCFVLPETKEIVDVETLSTKINPDRALSVRWERLLFQPLIALARFL